ncbi:MAG: SprT family zinc-dependent metalloprotease [Smithellaceae bacterium]|nr:M48 family metallopeptidase [Syntrophaceae bacterium]MDD4241935.1 SprT family zinc-dependent metalloprotease [Smithellaceae bacterium]
MDIRYHLNRSGKRKKTLSVQIGKNSEITVYAPSFTPIAEIDRFVEEKKGWIARTLTRQADLPALPEEKKIATGEQLYYLGASHPLEVFFEPLENAGLVFWDNRFYLNCSGGRDIRKRELVAWYRKKAQHYLSTRVDFYGRLLKLPVKGVRITSAGRRWGSCSHDNRLSFSFRLIMAPPPVIDYVVVHELMHIRQKNHSSQFWDLVIGVVPDYQAHRRWLRDHQHLFEF